mgnify:CR=1 FL=1
MTNFTLSPTFDAANASQKAELLLRRLGVRVRDNDGFLPIEVCGPIRGGEVEVDGSVSSQFITGLLLALPKARQDTTLRVQGAVSTPYLDMTLDTAARFGVEISQRDYEEFYIPGRQHYRSTYFSIEGDWSAAAMLLVAGAVAGVYPPAVGLCLIVFIIVLALSHYVSLSSMSAGIAFPIFIVLVFGERSASLIVFSCVIAVLLLLTHRKNIGRLIHHTESKIYLGKRKDA